MPGFITHLLFGEQIIPFIDDNGTSKLIETHIKAFSLGLQGPDIFFYHVPSYLFHDKNIGNIMHQKRVMTYFDCLFDSRNMFEEDCDRDICDAYILGFIGHYTLDIWCHPYIYFKSNHFDNLKNHNGVYDFGRHVSLETDIDHYLLFKYKNLLPSKFDYADSIRVSDYERQVISTLIFNALSVAFPENKVKHHEISGAIKSIIALNHAMHDESGKKKNRVNKIEKLFVHCDFISSMIPSDTLIKYDDPCNESKSEWENPWDSSYKSQDSFYEIMKNAMEDYLNRIKLYAKSVDVDAEDVIEETNQYLHLRNELLKTLSDISYITGRPIIDKH